MTSQTPNPASPDPVVKVDISPERIAALLDGVTCIIEDWENQAGERDPRDPVKSQIYDEAKTLAAARDLVPALRDALTAAEARIAELGAACAPLANMHIMDDNADDGAVCVVSAKTIKRIRAALENKP